MIEQQFQVGEVIRFGPGHYNVMEVSRVNQFAYGIGMISYYGMDAVGAPVHCAWQEHCKAASADDMALWAQTQYCREKRYGKSITA